MLIQLCAFSVYIKAFFRFLGIAVYLPHSAVLCFPGTEVYEAVNVLRLITQKQADLMRKTALTAEASYQFGNAFVGVARRVTFFPQQCVCLGVFKVAFQLFRAINISKHGSPCISRVRSAVP